MFCPHLSIVFALWLTLKKTCRAFMLASCLICLHLISFFHAFFFSFFLQSILSWELSFCIVLYSICMSCCVKHLQVVVNGDQNSVTLQHLNSVTEYQVAVFAIYSNSASEGLRGSETTCEFLFRHTACSDNSSTDLFCLCGDHLIIAIFECDRSLSPLTYLYVNVYQC